MEELIAKIKGGIERPLETAWVQGKKISLKTLLFRDGQWIIRKVKSINGNEVLTEEISVFPDEAIQALRDYIARERGKRKKKKEEMT